MGIVDTFSVFKLCFDCCSQYVGLVVDSAAGNFSKISPKVLLEPIIRLWMGYHFV